MQVLKPPSQNKGMVTMINDHLDTEHSLLWPGKGFQHIDQRDLEIIKRFQERTVKTIGTPRTLPAYQECVTPLAFTKPYLMHMMLSLTLMHDAYLASEAPETSARITTEAITHWQTATALFNRALSQPIADDARDALWATAALMGTIAFSFVPTSRVEAVTRMRSCVPASRAARSKALAADRRLPEP